jgi:hypothetical protein
VVDSPVSCMWGPFPVCETSLWWGLGRVACLGVDAARSVGFTVHDIFSSSTTHDLLSFPLSLFICNLRWCFRVWADGAGPNTSASHGKQGSVSAGVGNHWLGIRSGGGKCGGACLALAGRWTELSSIITRRCALPSCGLARLGVPIEVSNLNCAVPQCP